MVTPGDRVHSNSAEELLADDKKYSSSLNPQPMQAHTGDSVVVAVQVGSDGDAKTSAIGNEVSYLTRLQPSQATLVDGVVVAAEVPEVYDVGGAVVTAGTSRGRVGGGPGAAKSRARGFGSMTLFSNRAVAITFFNTFNTAGGGSLPTPGSAITKS